MSDYTTKATVELDVNGQKAKQELEQQRKLVKDLEIAYAKAEASGDKSAKTISKELSKARRELKSMQSATVNVDDVLRRLDNATPKELKVSLKQLNKELNSIQRGTDAWNAHVDKIHAVKKELESVNSTLATQRSSWQKLGDFINKWQTMAVAAFAIVMKVVSAGRNAVNAYASIDQEMANTQKFTGMTREAVELLNEEFEKMDTRTGREELNKLAQSAGRLGKDSVEDVLGFVRAGDKISVAMDELGEDAPEIISKLSGIFNLEVEMGTEKAMLSTGSAVNTLSQVCAASAPNLVDFSSRFGAIASSSNMAMSEMLAFGAVLDSNGVTMEKGATAMQGVVTRMYAEPSKFAKIANLDVKEFTETLKRSSTEGLMMFIDRLSQMDQMQMSATLKELGTAGAGVTQTFQTLANKSEELKTRMQQSNKAFIEATSVDEEFSIQNNTVQAGLDKAKNKFRELQIELGQKIAPVMKHVISSTGAIVRILIEVISFVGKYKGEIAVLTALILAYNIAVHASAIKTKALAAVQVIAKAATTAWTAVTYLSATAVALLSGNVTRATAAFKLFHNTLKLSPIGLLVASITAVVGGLALWLSKGKQLTIVQKAINDATAKANSSIADEKSKIQSLIFVAENERISMEKRIDAINKLNGIIPGYNARIDETTGKYTASKKALDEYLSSLEKKIRYEANEAKLKELIAVHESAIAERDELEFTLEEEEKKLSSMPPQIHTSGHSASGASQLELFNISADARRHAADKKVEQANNDVETFKDRMNIRIEKGEITPDLTSPTSDTTDKCPTCGSSPLYDTNNAIYSVEEWKAKEEALNRIAYATGEKNYDDYRTRMAEIDVEYYEKLLANKSASDADYLKLEAEYQDAIERERNVYHNLSMEKENAHYNDIVTGIKDRYLKGLIPTQKAYDAALQQAELEHKRRLSLLYEEGTDERLRAEREYHDALILDMNQRHKATEDAEKQHQELLSRCKAEFFGDNPDEEKANYDSELALLMEVYEMEVAAAGDNADERLRIEEAFEVAKLALRKKYNQVAAKENKNTLDGMAGDIANWLDSDGGKAVTQVIDTAISGMSSVFSSMSSLVQAELDVQTAAIEKRYDKEIEAAEGNNYKIKQLEKQKEKELAKAKNDANKKMYKMQVIQAVAQTSQNAIAAYGSALQAGGLFGLALAPIAAAAAIAAGVVQIAAIKKQQQAAEAQGYASGGFTPKGNKYEPAGIVHKGEWVASQELLASPVVRPMIEVLDYAQRTNTIGSIKSEDVSKSISAPSLIASSNAGSDVVSAITAQAVALSNYTDTIRKLNDRLSNPFVTVNTVAGDTGIKKAQDDYEKLLRNKSPKSKR